MRHAGEPSAHRGASVGKGSLRGRLRLPRCASAHRSTAAPPATVRVEDHGAERRAVVAGTDIRAQARPRAGCRHAGLLLHHDSERPAHAADRSSCTRRSTYCPAMRPRAGHSAKNLRDRADAGAGPRGEHERMATTAATPEEAPCRSHSRSIRTSRCSTSSARSRSSPTCPATRSCSSPPRPARSSTTPAAATLIATKSFADVPDPDVVVVPGGLNDTELQPELIDVAPCGAPDDDVDDERLHRRHLPRRRRDPRRTRCNDALGPQACARATRRALHRRPCGRARQDHHRSRCLERHRHGPRAARPHVRTGDGADGPARHRVRPATAVRRRLARQGARRARRPRPTAHRRRPRAPATTTGGAR